MINLIYASSANRLMTQDELVKLLQISRENNIEAGITGMLLYKDGNFLQVIEGEEAAVEALYATIQNDMRHHHVSFISKRTVSKRNFGDWQMGFVNLDDISAEDLPGYSEFLSTPLNARQFFEDPGFAHRFLQTFKEITTNGYR